MSAHPAYCQQLRDEISDLIAETMKRDGVKPHQVQSVLLELVEHYNPEPPTVRGEVI